MQCVYYVVIKLKDLPICQPLTTTTDCELQADNDLKKKRGKQVRTANFYTFSTEVMELH